MNKPFRFKFTEIIEVPDWFVTDNASMTPNELGGAWLAYAFREK